MTFSVIIPTLNQADLLRGAIASVLEQSLDDLEVIVINDFSTDDTIETVGSFRDERVRLINFRSGGVVAASRNAGIRESTGAFIAFLDSDDRWYPEKLERVLAAFDEDKAAGVICHNERHVGPERTADVSDYDPRCADMRAYLLLEKNCISTSATSVRRELLFEAGLFDEDPRLRSVEDYDLWLKLSQRCGFRFIPDVLGEHNCGSGRLSSDVPRHLEAALFLLSKHFNGTSDASLRRAYRRRRARAYLTAGHRCSLQHDWLRAGAYSLRGFSIDPAFLIGKLAGSAAAPRGAQQ